MAQPHNGQVHMMVMPKAKGPKEDSGSASGAAAGGKKKPSPHTKSIYTVDSFYQKLVDMQYVLCEEESTAALKKHLLKHPKPKKEPELSQLQTFKTSLCP